MSMSCLQACHEDCCEAETQLSMLAWSAVPLIPRRGQLGRRRTTAHLHHPPAQPLQLCATSLRPDALLPESADLHQPLHQQQAREVSNVMIAMGPAQVTR